VKPNPGNNIPTDLSENQDLLFKGLVDNMEDIVFTLAKDLRHTGVYGKWLAQNGGNESDFIGRKATEIFGKEKGMVHEEAAKKALKGRIVNYDWEMVAADGKKVYYQTKLAPINDSSGRINGLVGLSRDITDLMEERNKAQISDKLKSSFLSGISHEIRTPLNAILGFSQLILDSENLDKKLQDYANIIIKRGNDLVEIVDNIMEISTIQSGALKPVYSEVPVNVLLESIYREFSAQPAVSSFSIELNLEKRICGKNFFIHSDGNIIKQIFKKLIDNSIKFTPHGQISFGYKLKESKEIVFYVSDTGIGIQPERQDIIFDMFRTAEADNSEFNDGLGLGLSIVKELIKLLDGEIWFYSLPGRGTDMYFSIPIEKAGPSREFSNPEGISRNIFPGKRVLLIEDDAINSYYIKEVLKPTQVELITSPNGKNALEILENNIDIDLVFLDLNLPYISGEEILKRIRKSGNQVRVIIQSAFKTDAYNIPREQYTFFLPKPFKPIEVYRILQRLL
jgi:PAS domain S-box-containing protein